MSLTVVVGRANSGKTGKLHDVVRAALDAGREPLLLLPSGPDVDQARMEFARDSLPLGLRIEVCDRYLAALWRLRGDGRDLVTAVQRKVLLGEAIRTSSLTELAESAVHPGFAVALAQIAARLTSDRPGVVGDGADGEITGLLSRYARALRKEGLIEPVTASLVLAERVRPEWFPGPLVVNRFTDLTLAQERLLVNAAVCGVDVHVALPWTGTEATSALEPLVSRLAAVGELVEATSPPHTGSAELRYAETHMFLPPDEALGATPTGDVRMSEAFGEEAEAERIAAEVLDALAEGAEPTEIAVVFRDPSEHDAALRRAFGEAGIPAVYDVRPRASASAFGRALLQLSAFCSTGERAALLGWLRSPFSGAGCDAVESLEARWRRERVREPRRLVGGLRELGEGAQSAVSRARGLWERPITSGSAEKWKKLADDALRQAQGSWDRPEHEAEDSAAHRAFTGALGETAALSAGSLRAADLFEAFAEARLDVRRSDDPGRVQVLPVDRARARRFHTVIIGGLTAGDFSRPSGDDALSSPARQSALRGAGVDVSRRDERARDRLLFYLVASRARQRLVLSRQMADPDGVALKPCGPLVEFLDMYRPPDSETHRNGGLPTARLTFEAMRLEPSAPVTRRRALRESAATGGPASEAHARTRVALAAARRLAGERRLDDEGSLRELASTASFSATALEAYLRCPYRWFRERAVGGRALDTEYDRLAQGSLVHDALRRVYEGLQASLGCERVTPDNVDDATAWAGGVIESLLAEQPEAVSLADEAARASVKRRVLGLLQADAGFLPGFRPLFVEYPFGADGEPAFAFGDVEVKGRIDRIDADAHGRAVVVDYKTGKSGWENRSWKKFESYGLVQLPIYAAVVEQRLGLEVVGAFYRGVSRSNMSAKHNRGFFVQDAIDVGGTCSTDRLGTAEDLAPIRRQAEAAVRRAAEGIRGGEILARPLVENDCDTCAHRSVCGREASS